MCIITESYILTLLRISQLNRRILSHRIKRWFPFVLWDVSPARHHSLQFVVIFSSFRLAWHGEKKAVESAPTVELKMKSDSS